MTEVTKDPVNFDWLDYRISTDEISDERLKKLYADLGVEAIWQDSICVNEALDFLQHSYDYGLPPKFYQVDSLAQVYRKRRNWATEQAVSFDLALSKHLLQFFTDVYQGRFHASQLYADWDLPAKHLNWTKQHSEMFHLRLYDSLARKLEPQHPQYHALKKQLKAYDDWADNPIVAYPANLKLAPDTISYYLPAVRKQVRFWKGKISNDSSQVYDKELVQAIKRFQYQEGLNPDGVIGKNTLKALNRTKHHMQAEVAAQMERWRWYPKMDTAYIYINIPDFKLEMYAEGQTKFERKVVVGKPGRKTPVLVSSLTDVVLNPTWTLPPTIITEDLAKHYRQDTAYFTKKNIQILNYKREEILPGDWNPEKPNNYIYVQAAGDDNALGRIKFNFKNRFLVYLHDTNSRSYFKRESRALSSGCVRVQDPLPLAEYVIDNKQLYALDSLVAYTSSERSVTNFVRISKRMPIYIFYNTLYVNEKGQLIRRPDIYHWNPILTERFLN